MISSEALGARGLGVSLDLTLCWRYRSGFQGDQAPLSGLMIVDKIGECFLLGKLTGDHPLGERI